VTVLPDSRRTINISLSISDDFEEFDPFAYLDEEEEPAKLVMGEKLGEGGMGSVFVAHQAVLERDVAVKRLKNPSSVLARALLHEAVIMGSLEHPGIIPVHDLLPAGPHGPEVVMQRLNGRELSDLIGSEPPDEGTIRERLELMVQVGNALEYSHSNGVYHRDIKPENIMVGHFGEVYLLDWGLAVRKGKPSVFPKGMVGSPAYMAPEMLCGDPDQVDGRTDVFLFGATIHELVTGKTRHGNGSMEEVLANVADSAPFAYPLSLPKALGALINRFCHIEPEMRPHSMEEANELLRRFLHNWEALKLVDGSLGRLVDLQNEVGFWGSARSSDLAESVQVVENIFTNVYKDFNQIRFGFEQALTISPELGEASQGRLDSIVWMIEYSLLQESGEMARALLLELEEEPVGLSPERLSELSSRVQYLSNRRDEETAIVAERDLSISESARKSIGVVLYCCVGSLFLFLSLTGLPKQEELTTLRLLKVAIFVAVPIHVVLFVRYKNLISNQISRQAAGVFSGGAIGILYNRLSGHLQGSTPADILSLDVIIYGIAIAIGFRTIRRAKHLIVLCLLVSIGLLFYPNYAQLSVLGMTAIILLNIAWEWTHPEEASSTPV
jgi:eukaryotic-like serine/threonine-protein kinase